MLRLQDIMTTEVETVSPDLSLRDAMELFATRHLSGAPVVVQGDIVGVISATDLLSFAASALPLPRTRGDDVMWAGDEGSDLPDNLDGDEAPAAFFSGLWTGMDADVSEQLRDATVPERDVLEENTVADAMTMAVCSLPPDTPVDQAADFMRSKDIHRVLVMEDRRLVGIVTTTDVTKAVAEHKLTSRTYVFGHWVNH